MLVSGEVFRPVDADGNEIMVFTANGTTYAPLRALAEVYGPEVGYDSTRKIATITKPSEVPAPAFDFASAWDIKEKPVTNYGGEKIFYCYLFRFTEHERAQEPVEIIQR